MFGSFALPLFCASPLFHIPLQFRLRSETSVGLAFQVAKMLPALMTANGWILWLAWRSEWRPTRRRRIQMLTIAALALMVLPVACALLTLITAISATEDWGASVRVGFQMYGPAQMALLAISEFCRAVLTYVGLRLAAWMWNIAIIDPNHVAKPRPLRFTIAGVLVTTAVIAMLTAIVQVLFRQLPFADYPELGAAMVTDVVKRTLNVALVVFVSVLIARIGWPTFDALIPRIGAVVAIAIAIVYGAMHLQGLLPHQTGGATNFTLLQTVPYPIAMVLGTVLVVGILRSLGLHLKWNADSSLNATNAQT